MLRFLSVIRHKSPRNSHAFSEKAQHLRRWISLRMLTRGRLVPRQPRAIKRTTRTELHHEGIYIAKFIHWDNSAIPTQLRDDTIVRVTLLIIKGKMIWGKSVCDLRHFTRWNDANHGVKCGKWWARLYGGITRFELLLKMRTICLVYYFYLVGLQRLCFCIIILTKQGCDFSLVIQKSHVIFGADIVLLTCLW